MMSFFRKIYTPPVFDDELKTQQAYLLHIILWTLVFVPIPYFIYSLIATPEDLTRASIQTAFGVVSNLILLVIMRRGYVRATAIIQVSAFWIFFTGTAVTGKGVQGEAYLIGYTLVITIAGILLGGKGAFIFTFLSLSVGIYMVNLQTLGKLDVNFSGSPLSTWVSSLLLFPVGAILQRLASANVRISLARARASEERYRLISQVSSDYTFSTALDAKGNMHLNWVAGAFEKITGYMFEEYVAEGGWTAHLHPDDIEKDAQDMDAIRQNKKILTEIRTLKKDKEMRWVRVYGHPVWDEKNDRLTGIVGAVQDITEHKRVAQREALHQASLEKVLELGKHVTESQDLQTTYKRIWHAIRHDLKFDRLGIYLYDSEHKSINGTYGTNSQGEMVDETNDHIFLDDPTIETESFITALKEKNGLYFTNQYDDIHNIQEGHIMYGVKDYAAVAAWSGNKPVAVLCVDNVISQQPITDEQLESLLLFAGFAGLAIENSRLNDALQYELIQQKQAEEKESSRRAMLENVIILGQQVTEVKDLRVTLDRIWHGVHDDIGFDRLAIFLYDQKSNTINGTLGTDNDGSIVEEWDYQRTLDSEKPTSFTRALEQPNGLYVTNNFGVEFDRPEGHEMHNVKDFAAVSAWAGDKPVAIITVDNLPSGKPFTHIQLEALRLFGGYAGLAIENSRLNETLQTELIQRQALIDELETKNAELERFTYTASHDLKSPLVTITGFLGFLEQDALNGNTERIKSGIKRISAAATKMQALLNDLLELSRVGRIMNKPEDVPFDEIVNEAMDHLHGQLEKLDVIVELQTGFPVVHGDRVRLVEVVQNLIENALKYPAPKKKSRVEIGTDGNDQNGYPVFYVRDNGIGIEEQYHDRIFGLFNKLDVQTEGTGIGLSLVKRIVEVHNGHIWVKSEKDDGATFYFSLPTLQAKE